jgi:peptidoglycan/LPS O-acetylase OafA/YrhL
VLFSLLLPLYVTLVAQRRRVVLIALALAPAATIVGHASLVLPFVYLPAFLVGAVFTVALLKPSTGQASASLRGPQGWRRQLVWALVTVAGLGLLVLNPILPGYLPNLNRVVSELLSGTEVIGAGILVVVAARWVAAIRLLESPPVAWLGRVSFSLYLVHAPILIASANLLSFLPWPYAWGTGIVVSLICAQLFSRFVEQPSHHLSQRIGAHRIAEAKSVS